MRRWTAAEERLIIDCAGSATASEMANILGRSYTSLVAHVHQMRAKGIIDTELRVYGEDRFISDLRVCTECGEPRSTCDDNRVCKVCRDRVILDSHIERMHKAYANLPQELKEKTNGTFELQRVKGLMKTDLNAPKKPNVTLLSEFYAAEAMDKYFREKEAYELRLLRLDIDAAKQRRSKWNRKAAKYRAERGL